MRKKQLLKFWKAIDSSTSTKEAISSLKNKTGYPGKRTLERYAQAREGFKEDLESEIIAARIGYSVKYVNKIRTWSNELDGQRILELHEETQHTQKMRRLARALAERVLRLPSSWDKDLWRDLCVEICEDKQIKVNYYDVSAGIAEPHLVKALFNHLSTSGLPKFAELVGDNGKLNNLESKIGEYSQALLTFLKLITNEVKGPRSKVNPHNELKPGLTKDFILMVWNDAIQKAGGYAWIDNSWYNKPPESITGTNLWQSRCGACSIGIAKSKRTLKTYENRHKKLRAKYAEDQSAKDIVTKSQEMINIAQEIRQRLLQFSDMERLPGHCELC